MKKSDLKDWMVVETRNGSKYVVRLDTGEILKESGYMPLSDYDEDLIYINGKGYDIVSIYITTASYLSNLFKEGFLTLLWKRTEKPSEQEEIEAVRKEMEVLAERLKELENK